MDSQSRNLIFPSIEADRFEALRRALETDVATFDELDRAAGLLTTMMSRLMLLREGILSKMRKTGRLK